MLQTITDENNLEMCASVASITPQIESLWLTKTWSSGSNLVLKLVLLLVLIWLQDIREGALEGSKIPYRATWTHRGMV